MASGYTTTTYKPNSAIENLIKQFSAAQTSATAATKQRQAAVESIFDEIIARYGPEGSYGKSAEALIEAQKVRDVGTTSQSDISRGLYGIRPYGAEWEATTGAKARLTLEDLRMERLSAAQTGKAGFMERITNQYPDYSSLMQAVSAGSSIPRRRIASSYDTRRTPLTSLPGRTAGVKTPVGSYGATGTATTPGATAIREPIIMGRGYGPAFQSQAELARISAGSTGATVATKKYKPPYTASLTNRYDRYKKAMKKHPGAVVATYEQWYQMNIRNPNLAKTRAAQVAGF